jgi:chaperonin cofactor prefoldin
MKLALKMIDTLRKIDAYLCAELGSKYESRADLDAQIEFTEIKLKTLKRILGDGDSDIKKCEQELNALIAERIAEYGG